MILLSISERTNGFLQFLTVLLLFVFVLAITYFTTRWIAKYQKNSNAGNCNIELIETCKIAPDKYIQIVRTGDKYLAIAIGKNEITMLTELSQDQLLLSQSQNGAEGDGILSFAAILEKVKKQSGKNKETKE